MAVETLGVELAVEGLNKFLGDAKKAEDAIDDNAESWENWEQSAVTTGSELKKLASGGLKLVTTAAKAAFGKLNPIGQVALKGIVSAAKAAFNTLKRLAKGALNVVKDSAQAAGRALKDIGKVALKGIAVGATAAVAAIGGLVIGIGKLAMEAAAVEGTVRTFDALNKSIGEEGPAALQQLRDATRGMVSDQALMEAGNKFMAMGLAGSADEAANLAEIATQLGLAMGEDATGSMENFALMMANQSIPRLDSFGISSGAVRSRMEELMEANSDMTREMAFNEAVMEQAGVTMDKVGEQGDTAGAGMARMEATFANAKLQIGQAFVPIMGKLMGVFSDLIDRVLPPVMRIIESVTKSFGFFFNALLHGGRPLEAAKNLIMSLAENFGIAEGPAGLIAETIGRIVEGFLAFAAAAQPVIENVIQWAIDFGLWKDVLILLAASILSVIIPAIVAFLTATVAPIIALIAIIALLRLAWENDFLGIRTAVINFWEKTLKPAFEELKKWLTKNIPIALEKLRKFWDEVLLPALGRAWQFIQESVLPILQDVWNWISENLPVALEKLRKFWDEVLLPALENAWAYFQENIIPILIEAAEIAEEVLGAAIVALTAFWEEILLPVLEIVWKYISENLVPLFEALAELLSVVLKKALEVLADIWENVFLPAIAAGKAIIKALVDYIVEFAQPILEMLGDKILPKIADAFEWLGEKVSAVTGFVRYLIGLFDDMKVPDILERSSPSELEQSFLSVGNAIDLLNRKRLPQFQAELAGTGNLAAVVQSQIQGAVSLDIAGGGGSTTNNVSNSPTNNFNLTTNSTTRPGALALEFETMGMASR